jgi:hypothetical protein
MHGQNVGHAELLLALHGGDDALDRGGEVALAAEQL